MPGQDLQSTPKPMCVSRSDVCQGDTQIPTRSGAFMFLMRKIVHSCWSVHLKAVMLHIRPRLLFLFFVMMSKTLQTVQQKQVKG